MKITLIGHSTVLIEANGLRLVTDPFFSNLMPAYGRTRQPDRSALAAGPPDAVLLSHGHPDHVDIPYLLGLGPQTPVYCPRGYLGVGRAKRRLAPWETVDFRGLSLTAVPARHVGPSIGFVVSDPE